LLALIYDFAANYWLRETESIMGDISPLLACHNVLYLFHQKGQYDDLPEHYHIQPRVTQISPQPIPI